MTAAQSHKPAHGGYPQAAGYPYASLGAAKAQAQQAAVRRAEQAAARFNTKTAAERAFDAVWDEPTFMKTGMAATPDAQYRIVAGADNAH